MLFKALIIAIFIIFIFTTISTGQFQDNQIDTAQYKNLPYRDSTIQANYGRGYIDTFSIANSHFRLIHHDTLYDALVEKKINGVWVKCFDEIEMGNHNNYSLYDVNGDGYSDFVQDWKWFGEVYFYDPDIDNFINISTSEVSFDWALIDSVNMIFCDFQEGKQLKGQIYSTLYRFKGYYREDLYEVNLDNSKYDSLITAFIINKCIHDEPCIDCKTIERQKIEGIKLAKPINLEETSENYFDYVKFWNDRYKKLLGYR